MENNIVPISKEDITLERMSKQEKQQVIADLAAIENIDSFLKAMLYDDLTVFFNVPKESQDRVRGAAERARYILNLIRMHRKEEKGEQVLKNPRS